MTFVLPRRALLIALPWLIVIAIWYAVALFGLVNPSLVPTPHRVAARVLRAARRRAAARRHPDVHAARVHRRQRSASRVAVPVGFVLGWYRQRAHLHRSADQLLPRAAADRADPARHRLFRHRRGRKGGHPVLRLVLRRRDRDVRGHRADQPDLRARRAHARRDATARSSARSSSR